MRNQTIQEIKYRNKTLALVFPKRLKVDGVKFLTPLDYPIQIGLIEHRHGKFVPPHIHRDLKYKVNTTQEFLYIEKGIVDIIIFNKQWRKIKEVRLTSGDFILFVSGAHSVDVHKNTRIIEIKQGPYPGDKKAKIFKDK